ncbi:mobile mystery protein A [Gelidibacter salicanalis]|uniref:Mobile mystery protein A n=1 Tax=Gelidibacter salicanalis TaxID=291193 RepID=A0A934KK97_9FLAO|nr:mobile mystery protein A [Gelidibacter salicanalis]MBJ7881001.1 mobile mystery protein A [Gelidibacter salicanalis]
MNKKRLQIEQLDRKLKGFREAVQVTQPTIGWLKTVRVSIGMSLQQVADKLAITKQSVQEIEIREKEGSITLNSLKETANALDMQLVYGLVPKDGTIDDLIERKAKELALRIVSRTSNTMKLEDQENSKERLQKAIEERKAIIKNEMPKSLWD